MPNYWPLSSGNWSNLSNWLTSNAAPFNAGILPTATDDVFSNNRIIYIDGNYQVNSVRNISATNIAQGGYFVLNNGFALSAFVYGGGVTDVACLQFLSAAPASATLVGNLCAGDPSARVLRPKAFENVSSGNFTIIGNCLGAINNGSNADLTNAANGIIENSDTGNLTLIGSFSGDILTPTADRRVIGIRNNSTGNIFLSGNVFGGRGGSSMGIYNNTTGSVFVTGAVFGGSGTSSVGLFNNEVSNNVFLIGLARGGTGTSSHGIQNNSTGTIYVTGTVIGGTGNTTNSRGIQNSSTGTIFLVGSAFGGPEFSNSTADGNHGIYNESGDIFVIGSILGYNTSISLNSQNFGMRVGALLSNKVISITGNIIGGTGLGSTGLRIDTGSTGRLFVFGNVIGGHITGSNNTGNAIEHSGTTSIRIVGNVVGGGAQVSHGIQSSGVATIEVVGNSIGGSSSSGIFLNNTTAILNLSGNAVGNAATGISNIGRANVFGNVLGGTSSNGLGVSNTGTLFVSGNVTGGSGGNGITNSGATSTVVVSGDVTGGSGSGIVGILQSGNNSTRISGTATGGTGGSGISNTGSSARVEVKRATGNAFGVGSTGVVVGTYGVIGASNNTTIVEEIESGSRGMFPTNGNVFINRTTNTLAIYRTNTGQSVTMFTSLSGTNLNPIPRDVRQGVVYDFGALVGTLAMPIPAVVNAGVPVDNTFGTGVFTPIGVWSFPVSAIASTTSMGGRVKNSATIDSIGALIKNLT